ncbi:MAG TPA: pyridoxamine 5'-phosphate oxidase family protein [Candidatus Dormibacteraeota bacterium]|nr:pyridoxamine 5'-phosphate oxidase family protein [Candidatus Dormibacteraeota bacterium]
MSILRSVLENSLKDASAHSKNVYGKNPLTIEELIELANSRVLTIASTVKPDNHPHVSPTDLVVVDGELYLGVDRATARYRNLQQNPAVALMLADGSKRQAILEGSASFIDMKSETSTKVLEAQKKKYGWTTDHVAEFKPVKAFTWKAK